MNELIDYLQSLIPFPISQAGAEKIKSIALLQRLPKGTLLLTPGETSNKLYFIVKGIIRSYYIDSEGEELTAWIVDESKFPFVYSTKSYLTQTPSFEYIELYEESIIVTFKKEDLDALYFEFPETLAITCRILEISLIMHDERVRSLRLNAKDRLEFFAREHPSLLNRVQVQHLASFLGLSRTHVSALRRLKS